MKTILCLNATTVYWIKLTDCLTLVISLYASGQLEFNQPNEIEEIMQNVESVHCLMIEV